MRDNDQLKRYNNAVRCRQLEGRRICAKLTSKDELTQQAIAIKTRHPPTRPQREAHAQQHKLQRISSNREPNKLNSLLTMRSSTLFTIPKSTICYNCTNNWVLLMQMWWAPQKQMNRKKSTSCWGVEVMLTSFTKAFSEMSSLQPINHAAIISRQSWWVDSGRGVPEEKHRQLAKQNIAAAEVDWAVVASLQVK